MNTSKNKENLDKKDAPMRKKDIKLQKNHTSGALLSTISTKTNKITHANFNIIRFREMNHLFSKKSYTEGAVMSENHTRAYIKLVGLSYLDEDVEYKLIDACEKKFPILRGSLHIGEINNIFFITIEPLLAGKLNKDIIKELTDYIIALLEEYPSKK